MGAEESKDGVEHRAGLGKVNWVESTGVEWGEKEAPLLIFLQECV